MGVGRVTVAGIKNSIQGKLRAKNLLATGAGLLAVSLVACSNGIPIQITPAVPASAPEAGESTATSVPLTSTPEPEPTVEPTSTAVAVAEPTAEATAAAETAVVQQASVDIDFDSIFSDEDPIAFAERISDEALEYLTELTENYSPRASGSERERATAEFLLEELTELGYASELQEFTVDFLPRDVPAFMLISPETRPIRSFPMTFSGMGKVSAPLVFVGKAFEENIPDDGLTGKIAFIERGEITFEEKVSRVSDAGAVAAVVYNNVPGGFGGTLMNQASIPAVSITQEDGRQILEMIEDGDVEGSVTVQIETRATQNVIAEKPGTSDDGKVVVIGAHYDSVPDTEAANDNGTGVTSIIKIAEEILDEELPYTIRFVLFGVEEIGLFGSRHYVDNLSESEQEDIIAMLNFDSLGDGNATIIGDAELTNIVTAFAEAHDIDVQVRPGLRGGSSDHAPFQAVGIPAVFFFGDDLSRINSPRDTLEFVEPEVIGVQIALGLGLLDALAEAEE